VAIHAVIRFFHSRWVIPLLIEMGREFNYRARAELYTVPTSLAAIFEDMHHAVGNLYLF
jgi:hypothetical protein